MTIPIKKGQISFSPGSQMQISEMDDKSVKLAIDKKRVVNQVGLTIKNYLDACNNLLEDKFLSVNKLAPLHLSNPGKVLVACCNDGIVIRFDKKGEEKRQIITAWIEESLINIAPMISEGVVFCHSDPNFESEVPTKGIEISLYTADKSGGLAKDLLKCKVGFDAVILEPGDLPNPPKKPFCLLSVRNSLEIHLFWEMGGNKSSSNYGQKFLVRTPFILPVGWQCIEIFPFFNLDYWKPEFAPSWAENDILSSILAKQTKETEFHNLDPNVEAREKYAIILKNYKELLDSDPEREETLQKILKEFPVLLCPAHINKWPKLKLGAKETDFVFQEASGDYVLVELEKSTHRLFRKNGNTTGELNHARGQIQDWKRYIEDNLSTIQRELELINISSSPKCLIVMGRANYLTEDNKRKLTVIENESPKLKIMTYDDVLQNAKTVIENILGPLWETGGTTKIYCLQDK